MSSTGSLMEELEAIDWYSQRNDASSDPDDDGSVHLYVEESLTLLNSGPEAAISLVYPD